MIIKITTDCAFAGCEKIRFIEVPNDISPEELDIITDGYVQDDIEPYGNWEESDEETADEEGYDIE